MKHWAARSIVALLAMFGALLPVSAQILGPSQTLIVGTTPIQGGVNGNYLCANASLILSNCAAPSGGTPGGSTTQLQYNNAGAFGGTSGWTTNGTTALTGGASTTLAVGGATIGTNALAVTGTTTLNGNLRFTTTTAIAGDGITSLASTDLSFYTGGTRVATIFGTTFYLLTNAGTIAIGASSDLILSRKAAASLQFGAADVVAPIAQTIGPQSVLAGTSNAAGANWTQRGSLSTGSGVSGDIIFQTGGTGAGATAQNALVTALTIKGATQAVRASATIGTGGYTVATLPSGGTAGDRAYVTDQLTTCAAVGAALVGGGAVTCPVFYNGSAWVGG